MKKGNIYPVWDKGVEVSYSFPNLCWTLILGEDPCDMMPEGALRVSLTPALLCQHARAHTHSLFPESISLHALKVREPKVLASAHFTALPPTPLETASSP